MSDCLRELLKTRPYLLADGATGTNLFAMGLQTGDSPELWNVDHPDSIAENYNSFIEAGSDIVLTNTFGGTTFRLKLHDAQDRVTELNSAGARVARECADAADHKVLVAGSMGPTGELMEPMGALTPESATAAFAEQAQALAAGGADLLWIETMSSIEEVEAALAGAATTDLPAVCTISFDINGRSMMGVTPADLVKLYETSENAPVACGSNCGVGASELVVAILNMGNASDKDDNIYVAKANCGIPEYVEGKIHYNGTPEIMAEYVRMAIDSGAKIIGGCCGTTPEHIRAMREALDNHIKGEKPTIDDIEARLGEVTMGAKAQNRGDMSVLDGAVSGGDGAPRKERRRRRG